MRRFSVPPDVPAPAVVVRRRGLPEATDEEREAYYHGQSKQDSAAIVEALFYVAVVALLFGLVGLGAAWVVANVGGAA